MKTLLLSVSFFGLLLLSSCQEPTTVTPTDGNTNPTDTYQAEGENNSQGKGQ